ncbi:adenylate kinase family protein [Pyrobaculum sp.]|uniref:adenylate kinase family protein n=1 Tax=Pyrobaculum sp. TaxID=2004705 RepID=UPI003168C53A
MRQRQGGGSGRPKALITGTPGVGKTTQCRKLAAYLGVKCVTAGEALRGTPFVRYIPELDTYEIVDMEKAKEVVHLAVGTGDVVDTHIIELSPDPDVVVVLRKAPDVLYKELKDRKWPTKKILDNVWAEILDIVYVEASSRWPWAVQIDVTHRTPDETFEIIRRCVAEAKCVGDEVDWLDYAERSGFLSFIERLSRLGGFSSQPSSLS